MSYTQVSSLDLNQTAFEKLAYFALRPELYFDRFAEVEATNATNPGATHTFTIFQDLAVASSALSEVTDVTPVALSDSQVSVTMQEYGNAVVTTAKLRATSFIDVDPVAANAVGYNAGISIDSVCRDVLQAGTNVIYATGGATDPSSRATVQPEDLLSANDVRKVVAQLRKANVPTINGSYVAFIHPDVSYDFRSATDAAAWRTPANYVNPEGIYNGEIGMFEGVRFMESSRAPLFANASDGSGSSTGGGATVDVYGTLIMGRQARAKAVSSGGGYGSQPTMVYGQVVDVLKRFQPVGWKHFVGYGIFRQEALRRIESASSIGTN
jgi:N4-gp56 family major capsid protein